MARSRPLKTTNPDLRRQHQTPKLEIPYFTEELIKYIEPSLFTPLKYIPGNHEKMMRERLLTLPVMVALVIALVSGMIPGLSEATRVLKEEGLLWVKPIKVSKQALSKRLMNLPAEIFAVLLKQVLEKVNKTPKELKLEERWQKVREKFPALWIADGSTLEQLRKGLKIQEEGGGKLAGRIMMIVEAFTDNPVKVWYQKDERCNDKIWCEEIFNELPESGLIIVDLGFFSFEWFDRLTQARKFFLTRLRAATSYEVKKVLSRGTYYKDEIIKMGKYRSNRCEHQVRLVSVLWGKTWYYYITNVLDPEQLSAQEVCELYRRRWKIEEAFLLTKRLLGLAYLWVTHTNGVQIQILATLIFYTVLNQLVTDVAFAKRLRRRIALNQPKEKISVEMVFRSLYYVAKAIARGENPDTVTYLVERVKLFSLVKAKRKRHRKKDALSQQIWESVPLS